MKKPVIGLLLSVWGYLALAGQPNPPAGGESSTAQPATPSAPAAGRGNEAQDEGFIEFLGADDVDDAAWSEFLKNSASRQGQRPGQVPQDTRP